MCDNEVKSLRKMYPQLFDLEDSTSGSSRPRSYYTRSRYQRSKNSTGSRSSDYDSISTGRNGYRSPRKHTSKKEPFRRASYIVMNEMEFTKTNPLADDTTPSLQQRSKLVEQAATDTIYFN